MWHRCVWTWALELVSMPHLAPLFMWEARKIFRYDGIEWTRVIHHPFTANRVWEIQVCPRLQSKKNRKSHFATLYMQDSLPKNATPLCFLLYADKSKLSSFGSQQGYPVIARLLNLPTDLFNSNNCIGGGQIVGWLPIVRDYLLIHYYVTIALIGSRGQRRSEHPTICQLQTCGLAQIVRTDN
jgi:hypothetical protein